MAQDRRRDQVGWDPVTFITFAVRRCSGLTDAEVTGVAAPSPSL